MMTNFCRVLFLLLLLTPVWADPLTEATTQGKEYLGLIDRGKYGEAFKGASKFMTAKVDAKKFKQGIEGAKAQLGARKARKFQSAQPTKALPGAKGNFVVLTWSSSFANLPQGREVLVVSLEDGKWKLAGYSVMK